jgi:DNA-binding beta-propeller fold protein YncE
VLIRLRSLAPPPVRIGTPPLPVIALAVAFAGQATISGRGQAWLGAALLAVGGALMAVAALRAARAAAPATPASPAAESSPAAPGLIGGFTGLLLLLLVTVIAAAFRGPYLDRLPPGLAADEAALGLDAVRVLDGGWGGLSWGGWPIFHLLTIASVAALGQTALAVRLPDAVAGVLFAPALFLLGRQLGGTRLGAVAGLLGAVAFWHADLSRGAWGYGGWGLTCETLGLALLLRSARQPSPGLTALSGLLLGLALQASWGALAAIGAGVALIAGGPFGGRAGTDGIGWRARLRPVLGPFLVYFLVAIGPVLIGVSVPDRAPDPVTAEQVASAGTDASGLPWRAGRLLLLFNVPGDASPLHTLRGDPMLDVVTASLLVLGLALALARWRDRRSVTLIGWLLAALLIALVIGRSPQPDAMVAIHALPPALLLAAGALIAAAGGLTRRTSGAVAWQLDLTVALIVIASAINAHAMYVRRGADTATWAAYDSPAAMAAYEIDRLPADTTVYLADVWLNHPTIRFLAHNLRIPRRIDPATTLPFPTDGAIAYFAPGSQDVVPDDLDRVYEDGDIDRYHSPLDDSTVAMRSFQASAKDVAEARGVTLRAVSSDRPRGSRYTLQDFDLSWPIPGESTRGVTLDLFGAVSIETPGRYGLRLRAPPETVLEVNGAAVTLTGGEAEVTLARGSQRIHLQAPLDDPARFDLTWRPPGAAEFVPIPQDRVFREQRDAIGLLALYRSGTDPAAPSELTQVERYLQRDAATPALPRPYVADWIGQLDAPKTGTYRFKLDASGPASLWLDDRPVIVGKSGSGTPVSVVLTEGNHRLQVRLVDTTGPTRLDLSWAPPGDDMEAIPTSRLLPPDAPVESVVPIGVGADTGFTPLGTPRIRWLATTDGEARGVAVQPDGDVYVANVGARQVQRVVGTGHALEGLPAALSVPTDVEIDPDGHVWALDALSGEIVRLGPNGAVDRSLDTHDLGLYRPRGLGIAPDGTILIADTGGSRIVRLSPTGARLGTIGPDVGGPARIVQPTDVAVGPDGQIFVVNGENGALLRLSPDGRYERHWLVLPSDTEKGAHLAIGPDRSVWVSEPDGRRVSRFTFDGEPSGVVDQAPTGRLLRVPVGIAIGADGTLYVADVSLRAIVALYFQE